MSTVSETATAPSTPVEQSISLVLEAEVMADADTGRLSLVASTDHHMTDLAEVSPARLRGMVADARKQLDAIERLAKVFEAEDTIRAILAEHDLAMVEVDMAEAAEYFGPLTPRLRCWAGKENGRLVVRVPKGQDPIQRVNALAALVNDAGSVVREG